MRRALVILTILMGALPAWADPPQPVLELFRSAAEALADRDADGFMGHFDRDMPGYDTLRNYVQAMLGPSEAGSTIEIASDDGDEYKRDLQLDWLLRIGREEPRRQLVRCTVELQGKTWRITRVEPLEFFKPLQ